MKVRIMDYTTNRVFRNADIQEIDIRLRSALAGQGFRVLTETDAAAIMKKISQDMAPYRILGACNPTMAYHALGAEPRIGAMLPCNVILRAVEGGAEVSAIDPVASMMAVENEELKSAAGEVRDKLRQALEVPEPTPASLTTSAGDAWPLATRGHLARLPRRLGAA